jgi:hypothetical protein
MAGGGLSNDDFRRIMATPRAPDMEDTPRRGGRSSSTAGFAKPSIPISSEKTRPPKPSKPENLLPPGYRDRAQGLHTNTFLFLIKIFFILRSTSFFYNFL